MATTFNIPAYNQILQDFLNIYGGLTTAAGYNINLTPINEKYIDYATKSQMLSLFYSLVGQYVDSKRISTATGDDLTQLANDFGLQRRQASQSEGFIALAATPNTPITILSGSILSGPNGIQYEVSTSGSYTNGQNVPIQSISAGANTNLPLNSIMSWTNLPGPNVQSTALVSVVVTGGADQENDDTLRARLYLNFQSPQNMGNNNQVATMAIGTDNVIQQAFIYDNFAGSGTQLISLVGYQTTAYIGRDIPHLPNDGYVTFYGAFTIQDGLVPDAITGGPYNEYTNVLSNGLTTFGTKANNGANLSNDTSAIYGQINGVVANPFATVVSTVNNVPSDLTTILTIPYPVGAPKNGFGNGWVDFNPWPNPDGYYITTPACTIASVQGANTTINGVTGWGITINAPSAPITSPGATPGASHSATYNTYIPTAGLTHINWINRSDAADLGWIAVTATILAFQDTGYNQWRLVLDIPLTFATSTVDFYNNTQAAPRDHIFPASTNIQNYVYQILTQFGLLGPGEVTTDQGLIALGALRYPSQTIASTFPSVMGDQVEKYLVSQNQEVSAATLPLVSGNTATIAPSPNAPPNILIPRNISFYPVELYNFNPTGV